jgi:hypothetical protein
VVRDERADALIRDLAVEQRAPQRSLSNTRLDNVGGLGWEVVTRDGNNQLRSLARPGIR